MNRLERDIARIGLGVVAAATVVGATLGWVVRQVVEHVHDPTPSEHFRGK
jgi:hypothetical protein